MATTISSGQKNWLSVLNSDLNQIGDKVSVQNIPVTFLNGFSGDMSVTKYTFGSSIITVIEGWFNTNKSTLKSGTPTAIFKVPSNTDFGMVFAWTNSGNMLNGRVNMDTDHSTVKLELENDLGQGNYVNFLGVRAYK